MPKILTPIVLAGEIRASTLGIAGEKSCRNWLLHHAGKGNNVDTIRTGELDYLIEIYRKLKSEGFE